MPSHWRLSLSACLLGWPLEEGILGRIRGKKCEHTGTLYSSVRPRPVLPTVPNEKLSSRMSRYLYLNFNSICPANQHKNRIPTKKLPLTSLGKSTIFPSF